MDLQKNLTAQQEFMQSAPVTAPLDQIPAKFAHYLTSVDKQRQDLVDANLSVDFSIWKAFLFFNGICFWSHV